MSLRSVSLAAIALLVTPIAVATTALPNNEKICQKEMEVLLAKQQMLFSDTTAPAEVRRSAERAIDTSREAFAYNESYCDAQRALLQFDTEKGSDIHRNKGEINYFGRGHY